MRCRVLAPCLLAIAVALGGCAPASADRELSQIGLTELEIAGGAAPEVRGERTGWTIANEAAIEARVNLAPDAFLCRIEPGENPDVVQLGIGKVASLRCNALYSARRDMAVTFRAPRVVLQPAPRGYVLRARGPLKITVHPNFMKSERGLKWFKPLDKSVFKRAPAGWCSWYVYYQGITEEEVVKNTDWLAENLRQFGCEYVQIDDGWQGPGHGQGDNRDWYTVCTDKFPHGMKWLADYIRSKGFKPGIWVIPFSTSDEKLFRLRPELFIRRPDGTSIGERRDPKTGKVSFDWTGRYIVDPTGRLGQKWFRDLFEMLCVKWGYEYVKIDGQGGSRGACQQWHDQLTNPKLAPDEAYRYGLAAIKSVMGPRRFLLNCGGQYDSVGYCEGIRIGGDVGPSWERMQPAIGATMAHLYENNICFWTDPDVVCVRPPGNRGSSLTLEQARLWVTFVGITGQLLMSSDAMYDLPEERVELLRRIYPVADIRPMDLYPLRGRPRVFDLKVAKTGVGAWDVVAVFNWDRVRSQRVQLRPADLGLPPGRYVYYDVWGKRLLAVTGGRVPLVLAPTSCRLVCVRRLAKHPQLVGTSRHITQGADDLLSARWDGHATVWRGRSAVVGGDPYELRFTVPPGWTCVEPGARTHGALAVVTILRPANQEVAWKVRFERTGQTAKRPSVREAGVQSAEGKARVVWRGEGAFAYRIYRNGQLLAQTSDTSFVDDLARKGQRYTYDVSAVGWTGESPRVRAGTFLRRPSPRGTAPDVWLDELKLTVARQDWGTLRRRRSVEGNPISIGGKKYARGLGTHANSEIVVAVRNRYARFEAEVGVDDEKGGRGTVVFQVLADGIRVYDSGVMRGGQRAKKVSVSLKDVDELALIVTDAGDGINCDHADWANARLIGNK